MRDLICEWCNKNFTSKVWNTKTCSGYCNLRNWRKNNPEHNKQIKTAWSRKNGISEFGSPEHRLKQARKTLENGKRGEDHPNWKGADVGYRALHLWIRRCLGNPTICISRDGTCSEHFEWSNVSGEYKRDAIDWQQLCVSHHRRYDSERRKSLCQL